jgi:hypothetical protein
VVVLVVVVVAVVKVVVGAAVKVVLVLVLRLNRWSTTANKQIGGLALPHSLFRFAATYRNSMP